MDELATTDAPMSNPELIVKILSGLVPKFREICLAIHSCDTIISYEELFVKLLDYEFFLRHKDNKKLSGIIIDVLVTLPPPKSDNNGYNNCRKDNNSQQLHQNT